MLRLDARSDARTLTIAGPVLPVQVGSLDGKQSIMKAGMALVDTGSAQSIVSNSVARELNLAPVAAVNIMTVATAAAHAMVYSARFSFPNSDLPATELRLIGMDIPGNEVVAILGRDFLARAVLVYDGIGGSYSLTVLSSTA